MRVVKTDFDGEQYFMAVKASFIFAMCGRTLAGLSQVEPRIPLVCHNLHTCVNHSWFAGIFYPNHLKTCFLLLVLNANNVTDLQCVANTREQCAFAADVCGIRVLKEWPSLGIHSPYPHNDRGFYAFFWSVIHIVEPGRNLCHGVKQSYLLQMPHAGY